MFWVLDRPLVVDNNTVYGSVTSCDTRKVWESELCKTCGRVKSLRQIGDLCIELFGGKLAHFIWIDDPSIIVNRELRNLLEKAGLTGFSFRNVDVITWYRDNISILQMPSDQSFPDLFQVVVNGKGGSIFPQNETRSVSTCNDCGITTWEPLSQIKVDISQWDGSDVINLEEFPGYTLVSENFINFLSKNRIQGYRVVPSENFSMRTMGEAKI